MCSKSEWFLFKKKKITYHYRTLLKWYKKSKYLKICSLKLNILKSSINQNLNKFKINKPGSVSPHGGKFSEQFVLYEHLSRPVGKYKYVVSLPVTSLKRLLKEIIVVSKLDESSCIPVYLLPPSCIMFIVPVIFYLILSVVTNSTFV